MTLGIGDLGPQTWSVLQGPAVLAFVVRFGLDLAGFGWKKAILFLYVLKVTLGIGNMCPQAWSVFQGPAVLAFVLPSFWDGVPSGLCC